MHLTAVLLGHILTKMVMLFGGDLQGSGEGLGKLNGGLAFVGFYFFDHGEWSSKRPLPLRAVLISTACAAA